MCPYTRNMLARRRDFEPQGGEHLSAELDGYYKRLRRIVGYAWRTKRSGIMSARYLSM